MSPLLARYEGRSCVHDERLLTSPPNVRAVSPSAAVALLCTSMNLLLTKDQLRERTAGTGCGSDEVVGGSLGMASATGALTRLDAFSDARRAAISSSVFPVVASAKASS